jgi:endonuclease/exonuclease/phosphatase family metal-dependent hydrolase
MTLNLPPKFVGGARPSDEAFKALIQEERPDVMALQESAIETNADGNDATWHGSSILRTLFDSPFDYAPPQVLPPSTIIQQPVMARLPLDSMSVHRLPPAGDSDPRSRYTRTRFEWQGRPVVLYNLHLHSVGKARPWTLLPEEWTSVDRWKTFLESYREGALRRAQQARLIRRQIERESDPVIVVGDFNSTPHQWAYRHIAQGLQSAVTRRVTGWGATFPAQYPLVQIDHVLVDPAWQVTAARIPAEGKTEISDHRPVVAHLRWKVQ